MGGPNWDEDLHPRVPAGQSGGGQFAPKGDAPEWKDKEPKWKRDPEWNARKQTAKRMTSKAIIEETGAEYKERNVRDVARELNERSGELIQEEFGRDSITLDDHTPETDEFLSDVIADELSEGVKAFPSETWYRDSVQEALTTVAEKHPEIETDPDQHFLYTAAMAITSQGGNVTANAIAAEKAYQSFMENGKFDEGGFRSAPNWRKLNALIDEHGVAGVREMFDTKYTAKELAAATGLTKLHRTAMGDEVYGSNILGPKIGNFYQNLNGNEDVLTMDRWFMRAWGRITNSGIGEVDMEPVRERLTNALKAEGMKVPRGENKLFDLAKRISLDEQKAFRGLSKSERKSYEKSELVHAAERLVHNTDNGMREAPTSSSQRAWIGDVFRSAIDKVNASEGLSLTPASAQAVWWVPEQALYRHLGAKVPAVGNDYAKAFKKIAE